MMDRVLRTACAAIVLGLAVPPMLELRVVGQPNLRLLASAIVATGALLGVVAAYRRQPIFARFTTVAYGAPAIGLGLFATSRPVWQLLAFVVALLGMNVLLHHVRAYGPILAAMIAEDEVARRARFATLRSLAISGAVLAVAYGGALAILPLFALEVGSRDPLVALGLAAGLLIILLLLAVLPQVPRVRRRSPIR